MPFDQERGGGDAAACPDLHRGPPLLPDVGVLALVPEEWNLVWQPRQQVLFRLARYFHVVWADPRRHWRRWGHDATVAPAPAPADGAAGFTLYKPWLPMPYRPVWLARSLERRRLRRARDLLVRRGCTTILLYLWRPQFAEALDLVPFTESHYHIDDEYSFSELEMPLSDAERRLLASVDQVFVVSPALLARKAGINPHTTFVPNGVDFRAYAAPSAEPPELAAIPRPRIGYTGVVKPQLDWPLLQRLAASFVFVGPVQREITTRVAVTELARHANVHFLGLRSPQALAAYPQHFDVCIMPYRVNDYTNQIYPLKLHEYLASGRPTVGTPIATLTRFAEVVTLADGVEAWLDALAAALAPAATSARQKAIRQDVARRHDWDLLVREIAWTMLERLGPAWRSRLDAALERDSLLTGVGAADRAAPVGRGGQNR